MPRRVLVAEFLLADEAGWASASESMRLEAAAMLNAIVADLSQVPDVEPIVLLSASANASFVPDVPEAAVRRTSVGGVTQWLLQNESDAACYDSSLIIAPECDRILEQLLRQTQTGAWGQTRSLNMPWELAAVFSDKAATAEWLRSRGFSTPETMAVSDAAARTLLDGVRESAPAATGRKIVLKPRCGAGSDRVHVVRVDRSEVVRSVPLATNEDLTWVAQSYVAGVACSIGMLGGGRHGDAIVLPPARQVIRHREDQLVWIGGEVPLHEAGASRLTDVARQLATAIGPFHGYLGLDAVLLSTSAGGRDVCVIEVNPRFCTSYVGYRELSMSNLAAVLLDPTAGSRIAWRDGMVEFTATRV